MNESDPDVQLAHDCLNQTLHGPLPLATSMRLAEAVLRLSKETSVAVTGEQPERARDEGAQHMSSATVSPVAAAVLGEREPACPVCGGKAEPSKVVPAHVCSICTSVFRACVPPQSEPAEPCKHPYVCIVDTPQRKAGQCRDCGQTLGDIAARLAALAEYDMGDYPADWKSDAAPTSEPTRSERGEFPLDRTRIMAEWLQAGGWQPDTSHATDVIVAFGRAVEAAVWPHLRAELAKARAACDRAAAFNMNEVGEVAARLSEVERERDVAVRDRDFARDDRETALAQLAEHPPATWWTALSKRAEAAESARATARANAERLQVRLEHARMALSYVAGDQRGRNILALINIDEAAATLATDEREARRKLDAAPQEPEGR